MNAASSNQDNSKVSFVNGAALCAEGDVLENIEKLLWTFGENDYIVLDGLDIVCSLYPDAETKNIQLKAFIDRLIDTERRLCVSLTPRKSEKEDEIFARYWAHNSDQVVILQNLKTGLASDVSGKLTVIRPEEDIKKEVLYKLGDRGVEIVTAGLISTSGRDDFSNLR
ncbi:unnamed protein product [Oikopleura dioica]|uniref:Uncharacterized protein n=1 Tax=Oikopleura dioica TaxID=34765 RepID=E4YQZ5_OIKDI|nr:unnamed protein product [Oikopleura dioica]